MISPDFVLSLQRVGKSERSGLFRKVWR